MGVSISLLFVRGRTVEETLDALELSMTEDHREGPLVQRGAFVMANLPSEFHMIWSNTCDERRFSKAALATLSEGGEVVVERLEEHVMFSQAEFWRDGRLVWSVEHSGDDSDMHLKSEGMLPAVFDELRLEQESRGAEEQDFFDIPVRMADHVTGYRYDRVHAWESGTPYTLLRSPAKKPFWKLW